MGVVKLIAIGAKCFDFVLEDDTFKSHRELGVLSSPMLVEMLHFSCHPLCVLLNVPSFIHITLKR